MHVKIGKYKKSGKQNMRIVIDPYDTWNMDSTLAHIILPMLIQLRQTKHGSPMIDDEDVPEQLRANGTARDESMQYDLFADEKYDDLVWNMIHQRWAWVLNEMIFAFRSLVTGSWDEKYFTGESDIYWEELDDGSDMSEMKRGPNDTFVWDKEGYFKESDRIQNGFRLFGKYYQGLWD